MKSKYSEAFIEQALIKVYSRGARTVRSVAEEMNVSLHTVKDWMKRKVVDKLGITSTKGKRPQAWTADEQLMALHETHGLSGEALYAWCREKGLFVHHLTSWRAAFCANEKALAEAAALLMLQKSSVRSGRTRSNDFPCRA